MHPPSPLSQVPNMFIKYRSLKYWNTFGCNLTGHLPPTVKRIAQRSNGIYFEFFVQDEQVRPRRRVLPSFVATPLLPRLCCHAFVATNFTATHLLPPA